MHGQRDQDVTVYQREIRQAEVNKLLRLAKEAAEKHTHEQPQAETAGVGAEGEAGASARRTSSHRKW
jgi:hypothetical protein